MKKPGERILRVFVCPYSDVSGVGLFRVRLEGDVFGQIVHREADVVNGHIQAPVFHDVLEVYQKAPQLVNDPVSNLLGRFRAVFRVVSCESFVVSGPDDDVGIQGEEEIAGVESLRDIIRESSDIGINTLSIYAFSTENWRPHSGREIPP